MKLRRFIFLLVVAAVLTAGTYFALRSRKHSNLASEIKGSVPVKRVDSLWKAPDINALDHSAENELIRYGHDLIANTSYYLGPKGKVANLTNGMNCQNCHLDAGTRPWGNNYGGVYATYPLYRDRSGTIETVYKRVSDCIERSLNGTPPDSSSREMQALIKYIEWVGKDVPVKTKPLGAGTRELPLLDRPADPVRGKKVYIAKCQRCHGVNGEGTRNPVDGPYYIYPPLWGDHSYNTGAGLFRLSRFAGYAKANMPFDSKSDTALLVDEAWDVAAFVNSQPRPAKPFRQDWPDISKKPIDHPFGPYTDGFSETQHKYGPFAPIKKKREEMKKAGK